jgi:hypothetical protein
MQMWDVRTTGPAMTIEGPYICGRGIAVNNEGMILATASWRPDHPLQVTFSMASVTMVHLHVQSQGFSPAGKHSTLVTLQFMDLNPL